MRAYLPEGAAATRRHPYSLSELQEAYRSQKILEARAVVCDSEHNLWVDLGEISGMIPREEGALGIADGTTRDIALISRVNKPVCFVITGFTAEDHQPLTILSRRKVQQECLDRYLKPLSPGDVIPAIVTHLEPFGCFVDVGCGIVAMIPIDAISVSRISHPRDRFHVGQEIRVIAKGWDSEGKLLLSHKELLGSWEENAAAFHAGETVAGIVRSIEPYGIFVELTPNLAGLAESREGVSPGDHASVYIKSLIPERMKIKLVLVDAFCAQYPDPPLHYYFQGDHMDRFCYSPASADRMMETCFTKDSAEKKSASYDTLFSQSSRQR